MDAGPLKRLIVSLAPEGSRLHDCLWYARTLWQSFFFHFRTRIPQIPSSHRNDVERDAICAVGGILRLHDEIDDVREKFPLALREGNYGAFATWLCGAGAAELNLSQRAVENIKAAFARRPGDRVFQVYVHRRDLRMRFPLALTPAGRFEFAKWRILEGQKKYGIADEEFEWFWEECCEDPTQGIWDTYLLTPEWQERFPNPVTVSDWQAVLSWVIGRYRLPANSFAGVAQALAKFTTPAKPGVIGVNVLGHFAYPSGLQVAVENAIAGLGRADVAVSCRDVPADIRSDVPCRSKFLGLEKYDITLSFVAPETAVKLAYRKAALAPRPGVYRVGVWYWELETFPKAWIPHVHGLNEVWAPTEFIAQAMRNALPIPVFSMLPGLEMPDFPALPRGHFGLPTDRFLFLFVFDMSSYMARKNPLAVIRAFQSAFRPDDRVALAIKVSRGDRDPARLAELQTAARQAGMLLIDRLMTRAETLALIDTCDAYVSLHRSEGFGLTLAEAMWLGKPTIATAYSGNVDFMTAENSYLVDFERVPIERTNGVYEKGNMWAEPSLQQAELAMRAVFTDRERARSVGARASQAVRELLSLEKAGQRMRARLEAIHQGRA